MPSQSLKLAGAALALMIPLPGQVANPLIAESKQAYVQIKTNLQKAAEKMPEEDYNFKPTQEMRSFGQLVAHIADSQLRNCSWVKGETRQGTAASKTSKADLVAALTESFSECDSALDGITDATASDLVKFRNGQRSRLGTFIYNLGHDSEEYGYMAVYLRLKGIVPPSSEPKK